MRSTRPSLAADRRGAIVVMALFMAVVAAGALYYLMGIGDAILMRERMQDAADASAFSGAIVYARGMNIVVLVNMAMAALLAALILYKLVAAAAVAIGGFCSGISWLIPLAVPCAAVLTPLGSKMQASAPKVEKAVHKVLKVGEKVHEGVAHAVPLVAQLKVVPYARTHFSPPASGGVLMPLGAPLPVVDGTFDRLCEKGGEYAGLGVKWVIGKILVWDFVAHLAGKFTEELVDAFSMYLCGKGAAPSQSFTAKEARPKLDSPHAAACKGGDAAACDRHKKFLQGVVGSYDYASGTCTGTPQVASACNELLTRARTECNPNDKKLIDWTWREVELERTWVLRGNAVVLESEVEVAGSAHKRVWSEQNSLTKPCAGPVVGGSPWTPWSSAATGPVCEEKKGERPSAYEVDRAGGRLVVTHAAIADVVSCVAEVEKEIELSSKPLAASAQPAEICNCAELGETSFQLRALVWGDPDAFLARSEELAQVAAVLSRTQPSDPNALEDLIDRLGDVAVAQAEYFVDGEHHAKRAEWMWHMHWKARLRRFRFHQNTGWTCAEAKNECPKAKLSIGERIPASIRSALEGGIYH